MHPTWPPSPDRSPWMVLWLGGLVVILISSIGVYASLTLFAITIQAIFVWFLLRHLAFALTAARTAYADIQRSHFGSSDLPSLSVVVALKNEMAVAEQLLEALACLDYPAERLQVVLVDDASTDGTAEHLDANVTPSTLVLHRRPGSAGGKSGALNEAIEHLTGEIVVVFDADHRPQPDILQKHARHYADPSVAAVQGRCQIGNPDDGIIAAAISLEYEAGYLVNEYGRQAVFGLPAYGGANCSVRLESLCGTAAGIRHLTPRTPISPCGSSWLVNV